MQNSFPGMNTISKLTLIFSFSILAACQHKIVTDSVFTEILPEKAAREIVGEKLGAAWLSKPYVWKRGNCSPFPSKEYITLKDINYIQYSSTLKSLSVMTVAPEAKFLYTCLHRIAFDVDEADAPVVASALKSLGACTNYNASGC